MFFLLYEGCKSKWDISWRKVEIYICWSMKLMWLSRKYDSFHKYSQIGVRSYSVIKGFLCHCWPAGAGRGVWATPPLQLDIGMKPLFKQYGQESLRKVGMTEILPQQSCAVVHVPFHSIKVLGIPSVHTLPHVTENCFIQVYWKKPEVIGSLVWCIIMWQLLCVILYYYHHKHF